MPANQQNVLCSRQLLQVGWGAEASRQERQPSPDGVQHTACTCPTWQEPCESSSSTNGGVQPTMRVVILSSEDSHTPVLQVVQAWQPCPEHPKLKVCHWGFLLLPTYSQSYLHCGCWHRECVDVWKVRTRGSHTYSGKSLRRV